MHLPLFSFVDIDFLFFFPSIVLMKMNLEVGRQRRYKKPFSYTFDCSLVFRGILQLLKKYDLKFKDLFI